MQERIPSKKIATMPSGDPVRLDQAAEWAGQFWRPDQPDNVESGRLRYDPEDGLHLDLVSGARFPDLHDEFPWILGQTVDGRLVTLRDSFITNWSLHIPAGRQAELKANGASLSRSPYGEPSRVVGHNWDWHAHVCKGRRLRGLPHTHANSAGQIRRPIADRPSPVHRWSVACPASLLFLD